MSEPKPILRQPKLLNNNNNTKPVVMRSSISQVIVTLKSDKKLVLSSDAYHGILSAGDVYKCVFCDLEISINDKLKENHKNSAAHNELIKNYPHIEEFSENLLRQITKDTAYCTVCNVEIASAFITRHITSEAHTGELQQAIARASIYKPCN